MTQTDSLVFLFLWLANKKKMKKKKKKKKTCSIKQIFWLVDYKNSFWLVTRGKSDYNRSSGQHYILVLNFTILYLNNEDPGQMPNSTASDLNLHFLLRIVCPNTSGKCGTVSLEQQLFYKDWTCVYISVLQQYQFDQQILRQVVIFSILSWYL